MAGLKLVDPGEMNEFMILVCSDGTQVMDIALIKRVVSQDADDQTFSRRSFRRIGWPSKKVTYNADDTRLDRILIIDLRGRCRRRTKKSRDNGKRHN
jgi:hypothetical protein